MVFINPNVTQSTEYQQNKSFNLLNTVVIATRQLNLHFTSIEEKIVSI